MAAYEYNGNTYFYTALGKWVDSVSNPVKPDIAAALSSLYPEEEVAAREKAEREFAIEDVIEKHLEIYRGLKIEK